MPQTPMTLDVLKWLCTCHVLCAAECAEQQQSLDGHALCVQHELFSARSLLFQLLLSQPAPKPVSSHYPAASLQGSGWYHCYRMSLIMKERKQSCGCNCDILVVAYLQDMQPRKYFLTFVHHHCHIHLSPLVATFSLDPFQLQQ